MSSDAERRARAAARAKWPVRVHRLADEPDASTLEGNTAAELEGTTASESVAMVWEISKNAWLLSGRTLPSYARSEMPGRVIRPGEAESSDEDETGGGDELGGTDPGE